MADLSNDGSEPHRIASRTRSHVRIDDSVLNDNLDLPDIDMSLYQNSERDPEYGTFLGQIFSGSLDDQMDDTDPEYVFNNDINSHGWRFNFDEFKPETQPQPSEKAQVFNDPEFSRVLNQQIRQHIQFLTQFYLLTKHTNDLNRKSDVAKDHLLRYADIFRDRRKPSNLMASIDLISNLETPTTLSSSLRLSWRPLPVPEAIQDIINENPRIFPYQQLHPPVAFSRLPERLIQKKAKILFTPSEDKLLALALDEFKGQPNQYSLIASLLMTAKTKLQINNHIKNIKRSLCDNPIKTYLTTGETPSTQVTGDSPEEEMQEPEEPQESVFLDLMQASTTISKNVPVNVPPTKSFKHFKLKKSTINMMSSKFQVSETMGQLIVENFLESARISLDERHYLHLLQLLSDLRRRDGVIVFREITSFLTKIGASRELQEKLILFLDLKLANSCGCADKYQYWRRFFEFFHHVQLYQDSMDVYEKKLIRLVDALQKGDQHRINLAVGNLISKHPLLKRDFESLSLNARPDPSLYLFEQDFDDVTAGLNNFESCKNEDTTFDPKCEHFALKLTEDELTYSSTSCTCNCHKLEDIKIGNKHLKQHCSSCNLKFMKGKMYLVNKIKPIQAEWSYVEQPTPDLPGDPVQSSPLSITTNSPTADATISISSKAPISTPEVWTFEEDKELLEFCRAKAEQNDESASFDSRTFEELARSGSLKKSTREIADRFNQLMDLYKGDGC